MKIIYKCWCMKEEREIVVTDRTSGSDVGAWMNMVVTPSLTYDHRSQHKSCNHQTMEYVKIPVPEGTEELGKPVTKM